MKRFTKAALGGIATCGLILGATQAASGVSPHVVGGWSGELRDLRPEVTGGPLDGASASLRIVESADEGTGFRLRITGINTAVAAPEFGAHLHLGLCTARTVVTTEPLVLSPDTTSGHYKADPSGPADPSNEVWFDLAPDEEGVANDETWVPFVPVDNNPPGMSIVIHQHEAALPTSASPKEACLPVNVASWLQPV